MIQLYNQDCMEAMAKMKDNEFDLAIVDPPYGIGWDGDNLEKFNSKPCKTWEGAKPKGYKKKNWDSSIPKKEYFEELLRVSKHCIIWGGNYFTSHLPPSGHWIIWDKMVSMPTFSKGEMAWANIKNSLDIFSFLWAGYRKGEECNRIHPTQKPVALYTWLLDKYAQKGWKILDTHLGSGSSAIAAHNMGYDFVGYELDNEYFLAAQNRLREHQKQLKLFA
jgi:site-specific DNA-methyltransferase (adenine-specific)